MAKDIRFRTEKYTKKIISEDLYEKWKKQYPQYSEYTYKDFCNFWKMLSEEYKQTAVTNSHGIKLQNSMGDVVLKYVSTSNINKNYWNSKLANEDVGHLNLVTSGKNGKIVWSVTYARKINSELPLLGFQACRDFTTLAARAFLNTPELFKISRATKNNTKAIIKKYNSND